MGRGRRAVRAVLSRGEILGEIRTRSKTAVEQKIRVCLCDMGRRYPSSAKRAEEASSVFRASRKPTLENEIYGTVRTINERSRWEMSVESGNEKEERWGL